jgi:hypothetical protein
MSDDNTSSSGEINNFPHLLVCWLTEGEVISEEEEKRRLHLAKAFLQPFGSAEKFIAEMRPLQTHWEILMDHSETCDPLVLLSRIRAYLADLLGISNGPPLQDRHHCVRPKVSWLHCICIYTV